MIGSNDSGGLCLRSYLLIGLYTCLFGASTPTEKSLVEYPPGCSLKVAEDVLTANLVTLRRQHRIALAKHASSFSALLPSEAGIPSSGGDPSNLETAGSLQAARCIVGILNNASDSATARLRVLQWNSRLSAINQKHLATIVKDLHFHVEQLQSEKLSFRPYLAEHLRTHWSDIDRLQKRELLNHYYALVNEQPVWLIPRHQPGARWQFRVPVAEALRDFELDEEKPLRAAELTMEKVRIGIVERLRSRLNERQVHSQLSHAQRTAIVATLDFLEADTTTGIRGMMLCEIQPALPPLLHSAMVEAMELVHGLTLELEQNRRAKLATLKQSLAPMLAARLAEAAFDEAYAIDYRLEELTRPIRPVWIRAHRNSAGNVAEDAWLLKYSDETYHVRYVNDAADAQLKREDVALKPESASIIDKLPVKLDTQGQGQLLPPHTKLLPGMQLRCYRNDAGWHRVEVMDVSPFGVLLLWDGEGIADRLEPRSNLMIANE